MIYFSSLKKRLIESHSNHSKSSTLVGFSPLQYALYLDLSQTLHHDNKCNVFIFSNNDEAEEFFDLIEDYFSISNNLFLLGHDFNIYEGHIASEQALLERFYTLQNIEKLKKSNTPFNLVTTVEALNLKFPSSTFIQKNQLSIEVSDIISPDQLKTQLNERGYEYSITVEEPGTYSHKGEIFDIYPTNGKPIRLIYFDDMVEEIYSIDPETLKTIKEKTHQKVDLGISPRIFCSNEYANNLRSKIPMPPPSQKYKFEKRKEVLKRLSDGYLFENYPVFIPLFCDDTVSILDYLNENVCEYHIFNDFKVSNEWEGLSSELQDSFEFIQNDENSDSILPAPDFFYYKDMLSAINIEHKLNINEVQISANIDLTEHDDLINIQHQNVNQFFDEAYGKRNSKADYLKEVFNKIKNHFKLSGQIIFFYGHETALNEFNHLLDVFEVSTDIKKRIQFSTYPLDKGFYYETEKLLLLTEGDLFSAKKSKVNTKVTQKDLDLFAEQIATLKVGDYVIHSDHGVGKYLGLQSLDLKEDKADFLVIEYTGNDKVYVPVYKMNLIQKHASSTATLSLDSLRTNKFAALKKRASQSVKKLAFDLLKLQAERESSEAFAFSPPDHDFKEFELAFDFQETPDQRKAIDRVIKDMEKPRPMDHLVCGDVGFGKTEVAIRAAFKAVLDGKQVAVLVPTTILALQHYNSFKKRLKGFPVNLDFISRFKSAKETSKIFADLEEGKVDILIGTHKLLSDKIKFKDLGLVIVDEEQRFGVAHKEKLKLLKANVDFLTLTATPIPRTLQLSFLGLRDLSLIKTPPPKRQSIKTYIIKDDALTLQSAIKKELKRGGQVFIVHNKVKDIEQFAGHIRDLAPEAKIVIGHGQLPEKELEKRMKAFYEGEYQILIATTIIESGIDIPNANTMIIDRADTYGLSQLHQLRGRIGRSDKKAYAYFIIPNDRSLTNVAEKRLKALQTYAEMGSGFNIASCDLEIRGAGDILGAHQSGHIEAIGLELYMELLKDAIAELKGEKRVLNKNVEIMTPYPAYIPNNYIPDSAERLKQYKTLSNIDNIEALDSAFDDFIDLYGPHPIEMRNLHNVLKARTYLTRCGIKSIQANAHSISIQFDKDLLDTNPELAGNVAQTFLARPKIYQFSPDYKVLYKPNKDINQDDFLDFCKSIAEQIVPC